MAVTPDTPVLGGISEWLRRAQQRAAALAGAETAPSGAGGAPTGVGAQGAQTTPAPGPTPGPPAQPEVAPDGTEQPTPPYPQPKSLLERAYNRLWELEQDAQRLQRTLIDPNKKDFEREDAQKALQLNGTQQTALLAQIGQEENRVRDDARVKQEKTEAAEGKPKNGDTRTVRDSYTLPNGQTVQGTYSETYNNGVWSYTPGSAKRDTGFGGQPQGTGTASTVLTDGAGAYWMVDPYGGTAKPLNGPAAAVKTITDADGSVWSQNPDGTKKTQLTGAKPAIAQTQDGRMIAYNPANMQPIATLDTMTEEGRALATELQRLSVETARTGVEQGRVNLQASREALQPKFQSAIAQYASEGARRKTMAESELQRLVQQQKDGLITPEQAEQQFSRWMAVNVETPLAGYKAAAEQERYAQEQANQTRQAAENARVDQYNRQRDQLAYQAGEEGRQMGIELGRQTRAPEYIQSLGNLANAMATGQKFEGFQPGAFDPANYAKVLPNISQMADAAVQRLLSRVGPMAAQNVNAPMPAMPTGPDLQSLLNQIRYTPPGGMPGGVQGMNPAIQPPAY